MQVEIYSDVICPWCYIGKRRLERAQAMRPDARLEIRWRAFQLNPWMPVEGMARAEYLTAKFGSADAHRVYENIRRIGIGEGIDFAFDRIDRTPNTVDAHRLIRWTASNGGAEAQSELVEGLYQAYFIQARDLGSHVTLLDVAADIGLDVPEAEKYLASEDDRATVRSEDATARQMGIQGVPCFIVDRSYGGLWRAGAGIFHAAV